jgi:hypothetical protein
MTSTLLLSARAQNAAPQARVTQPINDRILFRLRGNTPPFISKAKDLGVAGDDLPLARMQLVLKPGDAQQADLVKLLVNQQKPGSSDYHKWLTPQTFGERFGAAQADIDKIAAWLTQHGFTIDSISNSRTVITFSGTEKQLSSTFHTEIHQYSIGGQRHYANASDPRIPAALTPVLAGFSSLTTYGRSPQHTAPRLVTRTEGGKWSLHPDALPGAASTGTAGLRARPQLTLSDGSGGNYYFVTPGDFNIIYNVSPLISQGTDGTGVSIAIVAESDVNPDDVNGFRTTFGLPAAKFNNIVVGTDPGYTGDDVESEADLDVEWSGALAPNATINLLASAATNTGGGILDAAEYAIDNNLSPILSVSWGECEFALGTSGNQYFYGLWQQAAAEGITVVVASGDAGSASCDQNQQYAYYGEQVSGFASTPYNTAVGGTDFSGNDFGTGFVFGNFGSKYWSATNDPKTHASALGYVPETPWNESCASPFVLTAAQAQTGTPWVSDTTNEALCNDSYAPPSSTTGAPPFLDTAGGGGGASRCTFSDSADPTTCSGGYPTPDWQIAMPGMPATGVRNVPDISFFSGSGIWNSAYVYCQSDVTTDKTCDSEFLTAGGTSFAAPAFAGVVALINQKLGSPLGNINYQLYQVGAAQYSGSGPAAFHDITQGNNAVPCESDGFAIAPNTPCTVTNPNDYLGVLPDYNANAGYDLATGLGSADVFALADAWAAAFGNLAASTTTLTLSGSSTTTYGTAVPVTVQVAATSGTHQPTGGVGLFDQDTTAGTPIATAQLSGGAASISGNGVPAGAHTLYARYVGDGTFAASSSNLVAITVNRAPTTMAITPSRTNVTAGESVSFEIVLATSSFANSPTGTVTLTDTTLGVALGSVPVSAATDSSTNASIGHAFINIPGQILASGTNAITISYGGDTNYIASSGTVNVTYTGPFSLTLPATSLTLAPGATTGNTLAIAVSPNSGSTLNAAKLFFSCPGTLPAGLTCAFGAPTAGANGAVNSTLTIALSAPLTAPSNQSSSAAWLGAGGAAALACVLLIGLPGRRRRYPLAVVLGAVSLLTFAVGCTGGSGTTIQPNDSATTTTLAIPSTTPAFNSPVSLTATVAATGGSGAPTGTVTFLDNNNVLGTASASGGTATLTTSSLPIGKQTILASYAGDSTFKGSNSSPSSLDVTLTAPLTVLVSDSAGNTAAQPLTVTVQ